MTHILYFIWGHFARPLKKTSKKPVIFIETTIENGYKKIFTGE